jgi:2-iminobutanoate/2-iminopropanoate deaminase
MTRETINTANAPAPIGPYNQAVMCGNMLFISGQVAFKPGTTELVMEDIASETHQVMSNLRAILEAASMHFHHVVKTTIFLSDMSLFTQVNEVYATYFEASPESGQMSYPARETVAVKGLPKNVNVEISMIAAK